MLRPFHLIPVLLLAGCVALQPATAYRHNAFPYSARLVPDPPLDESERLLRRVNRILLLYDIGTWVANDLTEVASSRSRCLARGFSQSLCDSVAVYCAVNTAPLQGGVAGVLWELFGLNQVFQVDCGNGVCYACCYVPGSGCHSAFHSEDGAPVINCNPAYGAGTREVGLTLVDDPDAVPGQPCLSTPQTCSHLPICSSGLSAGQIGAINANPNHIMKSDRAVKARARNFAAGVMADWGNLLERHHTSTDQPLDTMRDHVRPLFVLDDFITGRGCAGWRTGFPATFPSDWSEPQFRIDDASGNYSAGPSQLNGVRQLGAVRLIGTIPNLYNRLAFVESRIWTPTSATEYLGDLGKGEEKMLESMSPLALEIFRGNRQVQNYRLLAVPLPGESSSGRLFNGCALGDPPTLSVTHSRRGNYGIDVRVTAAESATSSSRPVDLIVLWGDGSVTRGTVGAGNQTATVSHDYAFGGKYQIAVLVQNDAGLRAIGALVAETTGRGTSPAPRPVPAVSEVQLVDLRAEIRSFAGNTLKMLFEVELQPDDDARFIAGLSRALPVPLSTVVRFGTVGAWNPGAAPLRRVTIRPYRYGDGVLIGFNRNYFTLERIRAGVFSTEDGALRFRDIAITPEMVRLYPRGSTEPVELTQPVYGADGRLEIPVQVGGVRYDRIDLLLPDSAIAGMLQGPVVNSRWEAVTGVLTEDKPIDEPLAVRRQTAGTR